MKELLRTADHRPTLSGRPSYSSGVRHCLGADLNRSLLVILWPLLRAHGLDLTSCEEQVVNGESVAWWSRIVVVVEELKGISGVWAEVGQYSHLVVGAVRTERIGPWDLCWPQAH